ncbi:MAG: ABC transporter ATP-binding protein [Clostridia bacterium]|nr:ABC transporter ATP-binding protein [Clostridia bacterium]MBQ7913731.1 ABC transporter ATP-binding protein [Clostridia bacterium]
MIEIKNLRKSYDGKTDVLEEMTVTIPDSSVFGLVGINGSGKSTLLRLISGVMRADHGQILIDGEDVYENEKIKKQIFFLPDDPYYTANVCANELADLYRATHDFSEEIFREYLERFRLDAKKPIRNFSKGMKRQVFVSLALAVQPKYLLLDEAFDGLDPLARLSLKRSLARMVEEKNGTVIISSHSLRELEDFCDSYGIIDHGKMTCSGDLEGDMQKVYKFQAAFDREVAREELLFCMSVVQTGRVVQMTARGDKEEILQKIQALHPLFVEEIPMDFEEMFIGEVQARGYMK